jgi:hypothetical protein
MAPYLAVQTIDISYGKRERGGEAAARRARLARGLPLPAIDGAGVLHDCRLAAWTDYEPHTMASGVPVRDGVVHIGGRVQLRLGDRLVFAKEPGVDGWKTGVLFELPADAWGRVVWNEIRADSERRWFGEVIVNAGLFAAPPDADVFLGTPAQARDLRRDLLRR